MTLSLAWRSLCLTPLKQSESSQHYRVTLETCDLWDIWSEWWGDMTCQLFLNLFSQFFLNFSRTFSQLFSTFSQLFFNFFSTYLFNFSISTSTSIGWLLWKWKPLKELNLFVYKWYNMSMLYRDTQAMFNNERHFSVSWHHLWDSRSCLDPGWQQKNRIKWHQQPRRWE